MKTNAYGDRDFSCNSRLRMKLLNLHMQDKGPPLKTLQFLNLSSIIIFVENRLPVFYPGSPVSL